MTIWQPDIRSRNQPIYLAIADAIEEDVRQGTLRPGDRLPPQRELADRLRITVGTVTRAYAEAEHRGLTRGEIGRGTYIAGDVGAGSFLSLHDETAPHVADFGLVFPLYSQDPDLRKALVRMSTRPGIQALLQYQHARGMRRHREAGSRWLRLIGLEVGADEILVCCGGQHALTVLLGALFKPGDRILVEELTYPGIKPLAGMFQLRLEPVAMDELGMIPQAVEAACSRSGVKALYTIPSFQNPTATTLPDARRREIAAICKAHDLWIIEDDCYAMTLEKPPLPLFAYLPERTFFIASLSKTVAAGLRVAFLASPKNCVNRIESAINQTVWMASPVLAEIAAIWIEEGTAGEVLKNKRSEATLRNLIAEQCLKGLSYRGHPTGYFVWLELPPQWSMSALLEEAFRRQVALVATEQFMIGNNQARPQGTRLSLTACPTREILATGLGEIADILSGSSGPEKMIL